MTRKQDDNSEANQSFTLPAIVGTWESLNLHPTVMIYPSKKKYLLSMLHVSDNGQAQPATYEIQKEDSRYFIVSAFKRLYIGYDKAKDSLSIITTPQNAESLFKKIGVHTNKVHNTMIVGGGEITYYLAKSLANMNVDVKIIEKNKDRCEVLSEALPDATVIYGDGSDQELLKEERIQNMDSFVACTDMDEENIILSLYAKEKVSSKVVTKINHLEFNDVIHSLNLDSLIYPKHITAEYILQYVRAMKNSIGSNVETLYKLMEDRVEALEFIVNQNCRMIGIRLQDMKTRPNLLVAAINRQGKVIIPGGQDSFEAGDSVIIVTTETGLQDIHEILAE